MGKLILEPNFDLERALSDRFAFQIDLLNETVDELNVQLASRPFTCAGRMRGRNETHAQQRVGASASKLGVSFIQERTCSEFHGYLDPIYFSFILDTAGALRIPPMVLDLHDVGDDTHAAVLTAGVFRVCGFPELARDKWLLESPYAVGFNGTETLPLVVQIRKVLSVDELVERYEDFERMVPHIPPRKEWGVPDWARPREYKVTQGDDSYFNDAFPVATVSLPRLSRYEEAWRSHLRAHPQLRVARPESPPLTRTIQR